MRKGTPYWLAGAAYAASRAVGSRWVRDVAKPLVVPLLADAVVALPRRDRAPAAVGLTGGWIGDLLLLRKDRLRPAAAAFALNHAAYLALLHRRGARFRPGPVALRAVPLAAAAVLGGRERLGLVLTYGGFVGATSALASDPALRGSGAAAGGNLFLLSDSLILVRTVALPGDTPAARAVDTAVAVTYVAAQRLLMSALAWRT